jgi:hypothetical protein
MISDSGRRELEGYARATWHSLVHLTVPGTGLPADSIDGELRAATRARYTSPTNVAMLLWSVLVARDLGLIARDEAALRVARVLDSLARGLGAVLQLVRCGDAGDDPALARAPGSARLSVRVERRQRLAGERPADDPRRRARTA